MPAEDEQNENRLYFAELKLEDDSAELKRKTMSSHTILEQIDINCTNKREITNCAAKEIIQERHKEVDKARIGQIIDYIAPQAKIDLIEMDGSKVMVISGKFKQAKTTTELLAEQDSLDKQHQFNPSEDPAGKGERSDDYTILFISMEEQRVIWEIFGGLYFIGFDKEKRIVYADHNSIQVTDW